jgi:hypothetical protein
MLIEESQAQRSRRAQQLRFQLTWGFEEVSVARHVVAWLALAITVAIAVILLLGG